jgi:7-cyano-7-deazaguanine reductase
MLDRTRYAYYGIFSVKEEKKMSNKPSKELLAVPNPHPDRSYEVEIECPEFTALCPVTGQPDFATITLKYVPGPSIVELKSLKLYMWSFREEGHFHEDVTNLILKDFVRQIQPRYLKVTGKFNVRGGIYTTVTAEYNGE